MAYYNTYNGQPKDTDMKSNNNADNTNYEMQMAQDARALLEMQEDKLPGDGEYVYFAPHPAKIDAAIAILKKYAPDLHIFTSSSRRYANTYIEVPALVMRELQKAYDNNFAQKTISKSAQHMQNLINRVKLMLVKSR